MLPWRGEDVNDNCRIANQDECRAVYHGDFSCESGKGLSLDWWAEQMDLHSVKVTEIEKLSNLKERIYYIYDLYIRYIIYTNILYIRFSEFCLNFCRE